MDGLNFLKESIKTMRTTGAIARSSKFLCREMLKPIAFDKAKVVVELGAGDGVMTYQILDKLRPDARLFCFEINPQFCEILRGIKDERFVLIEDSAEHLVEYLKKYGYAEADYIISAIPYVMLPDTLSNKIVKLCHKVLKKNGLYIQFHYSTFIQKMYKRIFGNVKINFVALNMPPAFVMICEKL
jgi:phospholipid N-methyltransferase